VWRRSRPIDRFVVVAHIKKTALRDTYFSSLLEADPAFTIAAWIGRGGQSKTKLILEGLRKAGLPE
jgi:adenylate cyclase